MSSSHSCSCGDAHADDCEGASLLPSIDTARVRCLNEREPDGAHRVLKPLASRSDRSSSLRSNEGDPELLLTIPFTNAVMLKSICVSGGADGGAPAKLRLFANRDDLDFSSLPAATQELELPEDLGADVWHPVRASRFQNITSLTLHFTDTHGADDTTIYFIGLKGTSTGVRRQAVTAVYEKRPQLSDHQARADAGGGRMGM